MAGYYLPHYDEASLWVFLVKVRDARGLIEERVRGGGDLRSFWLNAVMVSARSISAHRETPEDSMLRDNIPDLEEGLRKAREALAFI